MSETLDAISLENIRPVEKTWATRSSARRSCNWRGEHNRQLTADGAGYLAQAGALPTHRDVQGARGAEQRPPPQRRDGARRGITAVSAGNHAVAAAFAAREAASPRRW